MRELAAEQLVSSDLLMDINTYVILEKKKNYSLQGHCLSIYSHSILNKPSLSRESPNKISL